jgi:recombination protein RecA
MKVLFYSSICYACLVTPSTLLVSSFQSVSLNGNRPHHQAVGLPSIHSSSSGSRDTTTTTTTTLHARAKKVNPIDESERNDKANTMDPAKRAALDGVLNQIDRSYGRGSVVRLGDADAMRVDSIGSGSLTLDAALGGGFPKGRVIEIYGPESSGKTTLALHVIAECQKSGGIAAFIDAEHALDPSYAANLGVNIDDLLVSQPDSGEMALDIVDQLVRSSAVDVIVVDSVAALVPRAELEGDMSDMQIGLQARLMSKAMRKITGSLSLSQCTVVFLNQLRSKVGVLYGSPEVTSGGNALKFYASVRLDTRRKEILPDNSGIRVKVKVVKNKVAAPFKSVMVDILFGTGIDRMGCTLDAALDLGIVERKGSWYAYKGSNLAQGRQNVVDLLKTDPILAEQMETEVRLALSDSGKQLSTSVITEAPDEAIVPSLSDDFEETIGALSYGAADDSFME